MLARARELATNGAAEAADNKTQRAKTPTLPRSATLPGTKNCIERMAARNTMMACALPGQSDSLEKAADQMQSVAAMYEYQ
jgi:hypothetical protein